MKRMLSFFRGYRVQTVLAPLFKLFEAILELFVPLLVADIIDKGIGSGNAEYVWTRSVLLVALALVGLGFSLTAQYFAARSAVGYSASMKRALYRHVQSLSYCDLDRLGTSSLLTRMNADATQVQNGINMLLRLFLRSPFIVFGALVMAFVVDPGSAWLFAVVIPLLALVVVGVTVGCLPLYRKNQEKLDRLTEVLRENLAGVRVIRAYACEEGEEQSFRRAHGGLTRAQTVAGRVAALLNPLTFALVNVGIIALIWRGGMRVDSGSLTQGGVIALYNYMSQILVELVKLANLIILLTKSMASYRRIGEVFEAEPTQHFGTSEVQADPAAPAVSFDNVSLRYTPTADDALEKVSMQVWQGQTVGIIGSTGSGKSTLVNLIPRFYDATEGQVCIQGVPIADYPKEQLRRTVHVVEQKAVLFRGTIRDNLLWGNPTATDEELLRAASLAQATDVLKAKGGLDGLVEEGGRNLSGGQRQRLTIARALVGDPSILILDDSASALDNATDRALRQALRTLPCTTFIVSQRTNAVQGADCILVLEDGQVVGQGDHDSLVADCEVYREIHAAQQGGAL